MASVARRVVADEDDRLAGTGDVAGVLGEAAVEADVDRTPQVSGGERLGSAGVDQHGALAGAAGDSVDVERDGRLGVVEQRRAARRLLSAVNAKYSGATDWPSVTTATNVVFAHRAQRRS